jgi:hypothetical protein
MNSIATAFNAYIHHLISLPEELNGENVEPIIGDDGYFYYLYIITNLVNGKVYFGVHGAETLNNRYMGSGTVLGNSKVKHGINNFRLYPLRFFKTREEMFAAERELVTLDFINTHKEYIYNRAKGGEGGFVEGVQSLGGKAGSAVLLEKYGKEHFSNLSRKFVSSLGNKEEVSAYYSKLSKSPNNRRTLGKIWVSNYITGESRMINENLLPEYLIQGYCRGKLVTKRGTNNEEINFEYS